MKQCVHWLIKFLPFIRNVSFCGGQKIHRLTSGQNIDNMWHEWSVEKETSILHFLPLVLRKHCARVQEGLLWSNVFWSRLVHLPNQSRNSPPEIKIDISDGEGSTLQHLTTKWEAIHSAVIASVGQKVSLLQMGGTWHVTFVLMDGTLCAHVHMGANWRQWVIFKQDRSRMLAEVFCSFPAV